VGLPHRVTGTTDTVRIELFDADGRSIFGAIENRVEALPQR
jgi:hypothetical protein